MPNCIDCGAELDADWLAKHPGARRCPRCFVAALTALFDDDEYRAYRAEDRDEDDDRADAAILDGVHVSPGDEPYVVDGMAIVAGIIAEQEVTA